MNAHLIRLSGMGDTSWCLVNDAGWAYLLACETWRPGQEKPQVPEDLIDTWLAEMDVEESNREEALESLSLPERSSSRGNDVALSICGSLFDGERFYTWDPSVKDLNAFLEKHSLTLVQEYDGYMY